MEEVTLGVVDGVKTELGVHDVVAEHVMQVEDVPVAVRVFVEDEVPDGVGVVDATCDCDCVADGVCVGTDVNVPVAVELCVQDLVLVFDRLRVTVVDGVDSDVEVCDIEAVSEGAADDVQLVVTVASDV